MSTRNRFLVMAFAAALQCLGPAFTATAQSNAFLDGLFASGKVSAGQAAYLVLVASDNLGDDADEARAFDLLGTMGWAPRGLGAGDAISLSRYSWILMRAFGLRGGLMYTLFPGPRYAYRELVARSVAQGRGDPDMAVTPEIAVRMIARMYDIKGGQ